MAGDEHREMQVIAPGKARHAALADGLASVDAIARLDGKRTLRARVTELTEILDEDGYLYLYDRVKDRDLPEEKRPQRPWEHAPKKPAKKRAS